MKLSKNLIKLPTMDIIKKLCIFSSIYIIVLIIIAPLIDHLFTSLDQDKIIQETNIQILIEIILHILVLTIVWYYLNRFLQGTIRNIFKIKIKEEATKSAIDIISAIALIGLQKNLIDKLRYITTEHPFRLSYLYE